MIRRPQPTICKCLKHKIYFGSCLPRYKQGRGPLLSCLAKKGTGRSVGDRSLFLPDRFVCLRFYPRWEGKARTYKSLADALLTLLLLIFLQGILLMTNVWSDLLRKLCLLHLRRDLRNVEDKNPMGTTHYSWRDRAVR